jgi:hypothetical protein
MNAIFRVFSTILSQDRNTALLFAALYFDEFAFFPKVRFKEMALACM